MKPKWLVGALAATVAACGGTRQSEGGACADVVKWHGEVRYGTWVEEKTAWPSIERTEIGYVPRCNDGGGEGGGANTELVVFKGVAPEVAFARRYSDTGKIYALYLSPDYFLAARSHPLHDVYWGSTREPDESRGKPCRRLRPVSGRVTAVTTQSARISLGTEWRVDAKTVIEAPPVHGVPRIKSGQQVHIDGVLCGRTRHVIRTITVTA